ncbi:hypothetical protein [Rhodococcus sp. ABRD24]|uniref:hypothetical protein n=1 Tax=Rhodococcus sp. ABRD24 TaxID=2507582 RepID=UPI0013F16519|nr:hypothetical protein [Rhodococcus sp. ABRD24]
MVRTSWTLPLLAAGALLAAACGNGVTPMDTIPTQTETETDAPPRAWMCRRRT